MEPCPTSGPIEGCCLVAVPNTSQWAVACAGGQWGPAPAVIPTLTTWGALVFCALLVAVALRKLR